MLLYGGVKAHHMKNTTNVDFKSRDLPLFALAWQSWKLLDTSAGIIFKGALVAGAFFLVGTALSGGPFFNEETRIRMQAEKGVLWLRALFSLSGLHFRADHSLTKRLVFVCRRKKFVPLGV